MDTKLIGRSSLLSYLKEINGIQMTKTETENGTILYFASVID